MKSRYIEWLLKQGNPLFRGGGVYWRLYQNALVPAKASPCFVKLDRDDARKLLRQSGAFLLRYCSNPSEQATEWWFIVCDEFDSKKISGKTRYNINRGNRVCSVKKIEAEWLASQGYQCYSAAFDRYKNASPLTEKVFQKEISSTIEGPFDYWGIFIGPLLVGYCQCILENDYVYTSISKYHPNYLRDRTAYALIFHLITHYVVERGMTIYSGSRNIAHSTNYQNFLQNFGYRKLYSRLNVVYQPWLYLALKAAQPVKGLIQYLPEFGPVHKLRSLLLQEEMRRRCNMSFIRRFDTKLNAVEAGAWRTSKHCAKSEHRRLEWGNR